MSSIQSRLAIAVALQYRQVLFGVYTNMKKQWTPETWRSFAGAANAGLQGR